MAGKPSAAGARAARWITAEIKAGRTPTPAAIVRRYSLSPSQARRLAAKAGLPPQPVGWPRAVISRP